MVANNLHLHSVQPSREHGKVSQWKRRLLVKYGSLFVITALPIAAIAWQTGASGEGGEPIDAAATSLPFSVSEPTAEGVSDDQSSAGNKTTVELHATQQSSSITDADQPANDSTETSLTINGQSVPVPESGQLNQTYVSDDGSTSTVNISISGSDASNTTSSSSSISIDVNNGSP